MLGGNFGTTSNVHMSSVLYLHDAACRLSLLIEPHIRLASFTTQCSQPSRHPLPPFRTYPPLKAGFGFRVVKGCSLSQTDAQNFDRDM
jgi:hypothetical protein